MIELIKEAEYLGMMEASYENKTTTFAVLCNTQAKYNVKQAKYLRTLDKAERTKALNKLQASWNAGYNNNP